MLVFRIFTTLLVCIVLQTDFVIASRFGIDLPSRYILIAPDETGIILNTMEKGIWKDIRGYEWMYQISDFGRVKSLARMVKHMGYSRIHSQRILKPSKSPAGYWTATLSKDRNHVYKTIHRLVAVAFIINPECKPQVNHKNGIKTDNRLENLEWVTQSENMQHAYRTGLQKPCKNQKIGAAKYCVENYSKPVLQLGLSGELINNFPSIAEATRQTGVTNIGACCLGKFKAASGFKWEFKNKE